MKPTLYLSNHASRRTPGAHGPGRKWTAMALPRHFERGEGRVWALAPEPADLLAVKAGTLPESEYFARCRARFAGALEIGTLTPRYMAAATAGSPVGGAPVQDGDTACCACSRADALAGRCHISHAAPYLLRAGWSVVLHGHRACLGEDGTLGVLGPAWLWSADEFGDSERPWTYPLSGGDCATAARIDLVEGVWEWKVWLPGGGDHAQPWAEGSVPESDAESVREAERQVNAALERMMEGESSE